MFRAIFALILGVFAASASLAQETGLRRMDTGDQARGWEAVGRLELNGRGFCTGALIAPDLVLTAAHCLYDKASGARLDIDRIEFRAGWRNGRAEAYRKIRRAVQHPDYVYGAKGGPERVANDLALLVLHHPIRSSRVVPFQTAVGLGQGDSVSVVSYAQDRAEAPSYQEKCDVLGEQQGIFVMTCDVHYGSSGAPVFAIRDGAPQIVSVVSAMAQYESTPVALGVTLDGPLQRLMADARADGKPQVRKLGQSGTKSGLGAKFVRP